jgi:hypothetical protein
MKATDQNGLTLEVFSCGWNEVRDLYWYVYRYVGRAAPPSDNPTERLDLWEDQDGDRITTETCECDGGFLPGAFLGGDYDLVQIQRCDLCKQYPDDETACEAYVAALNRHVEELRFKLVYFDAYSDDDGDLSKWIASIGWAPDGRPLTVGAFRDILDGLKIDLGGGDETEASRRRTALLAEIDVHGMDPTIRKDDLPLQRYARFLKETDPTIDKDRERVWTTHETLDAVRECAATDLDEGWTSTVLDLDTGEHFTTRTRVELESVKDETRTEGLP